MPAAAGILPFIPLIASGVSTIGGLVTGAQQSRRDQKYIEGQDKQMEQVVQFANTLVSRVSRGEYEAQANRDVNAAMQDVFSVMASRGMGRSTAGLTATAETAGAIRSQYGKQYLSDRLSSLQTAGSMIGGVANSDRRGFSGDPYADFRSGVKGLSDTFAGYQAKGFPWTRPATATVPTTGPWLPGTAPGNGTGMNWNNPTRSPR